MTDIAPLSVDELLARAAANAKNRTPAGGSAVQKLLAGREDPVDTVELSAVQKFLKEQEARNPAKKESYFDSDQYLNAKVVQLRFQLDFYSRLGGDIGNSAMESIEKEIRGIIAQQQEKLKKTNDEAAAKQKELDAANAEKNKFAGLPNADQLIERALARLNGEVVPEFTAPSDDDKAESDAVAALLKRAKDAVAARGSTVNTSA